METFKRSLEFQKILKKKPSFVTKWGVYLLTFIVVALVLSSKSVSYPIFIPGKIVNVPKKMLYFDKRYDNLLSKFIGKEIRLANIKTTNQQYIFRITKIIEKNNGIMVLMDRINEEHFCSWQGDIQLLTHLTLYEYIFQK